MNFNDLFQYKDLDMFYCDIDTEREREREREREDF